MIPIALLASVLVWTGSDPREEVAAVAADWRDIRQGRVIPDEGYCDQPYVVHAADGAWLCVMTTGSGHEGAGGQHVVVIRSDDHGESWSPPVELESAHGPVASWGMPLVTPTGRIYVFYVFNGDEITGRRADMLGWYCYRYSDDDGRSWSKRHRLPLRVTEVDRGNDWKGEVQIFWGIGKPIVTDGAAVFGFSKIGRYMLDESEGWFFRSPNLLTERDPSAIEWELLPEGEHGLRAPEHGSIQSEQNLVPLANGDLYCVYRTTMGYPCHSYSRDGGRSWTLPEAATYSPGGRRIKHPRACPRIWKASSGRFLLWFHNTGEKDWSPGTRNPGWITGGAERDGFVHWSEPEILLYDEDSDVRISYPDLIEEGGRVWITETQKSVARVHEIDPTLLEGLWSPPDGNAIRKDALLDVSGEDSVDSRLPALPDVDRGGGLTFELSLPPRRSREAEEVVVAGGAGTGIVLHRRDGGVVFEARHGDRSVEFSTVAIDLDDGEQHHIVLILDGGPGIIRWVVDGVLLDGGDEARRGWQRFRAGDDPELVARVLQEASGREIVLASERAGDLRIYARALRTSEAIASFRAIE